MMKHRKKQEDLWNHESQRLRIALVRQTSEKAVQQEEPRAAESQEQARGGCQEWCRGCRCGTDHELRWLPTRTENAKTIPHWNWVDRHLPD